MTALALHNIQKRYGSAEIVRGIDLQVESGEFVVFVGPSGCGKSTLLRMIAGLEPISGGELRIGGEVMNHRPAADRGIAMVFQSYALYPHMSVYKNMSFGLETAKVPRDEIDRQVRKAAEILQITALLERKPKQLSGGQRQRVAIGRAIVRNPKVFLFDEPLSNLDAELRVQTRVEIAKLHADIGATMIYVTHDQVEAMTLADRIVVLRAGQVEQFGTPLDIYNHPANRFVAGFIGSPKMNFFTISARGGDHQRTAFDLAGKLIGISGLGASGDELCLGVRPEHLVVDAPASQPLGTATISHVEYLGGQTIAYGALADGQAVTLSRDGQQTIRPGQVLTLGVEPAHCHVFDTTGARIASARLTNQ